MAFSESLTVRILGDSSELQRELNSVLSQLDRLNDRLSSTAETAKQFTNSFSRLSSATQPLQKLHSQLQRFGQLIQSISKKPISLNVSPALQALRQLTAAAQAAAAAVQAVSIPNIIGPAFPPRPAGPVFPPAPTGNPRRLATGGLVTGTPGIDRVPAQLTAGEYVLNQTAVRTLGLTVIERMNQDPSSLLAPQSTSPQTGDKPQFPSQFPSQLSTESSGPVPTPHTLSALNVPERSERQGSALNDFRRTVNKSVQASSTQTTSNYFGGITIQVQEQNNAQEMLREMEVRGIGRRIRQG